ncbi:AIR carboxylase family protein [Candidatus Woesearchaeota archaeon]|nr:AIR carboxylase family protein [Candidatus Woesearchaeota archaeon]
MPKVLVVFGSKSDSAVYNKIVKGLKKEKIKVELKVASAHRTPEEVEKIANETDADLIIAGAGLSAALPGVIGSKTVKPVIGVPVKSNYEGLDALLSIVQMPSGIPVLAVGVEQTAVVVENAKKMLKEYEGVTIIADKETKAVEKAEDILKEFKIDYKKELKADPKTINLEFVYFDEPLEEKDELVIYCPLLMEDDDKAEAAINLLKHSNHGLWVGLNNGKNAALAAVEILNKDGKYSSKLNEVRKK